MRCLELCPIVFIEAAAGHANIKDINILSVVVR
jgi:hypothetical protein